MNKVEKIFFVIVVVIGLYACVRCAIDPYWYFGKSFVPEWVTQETFWDYVLGGRR